MVTVETVDLITLRKCPRKMQKNHSFHKTDAHKYIHVVYLPFLECSLRHVSIQGIPEKKPRKKSRRLSDVITSTKEHVVKIQMNLCGQRTLNQVSLQVYSGALGDSFPVSDLGKRNPQNTLIMMKPTWSKNPRTRISTCTYEAGQKSR